MNPRKKQDRNYKPGNKPNVDRTQPRGGSDRKVYRPRKEEESIRINRYIAQAGICSRRKADELIEEGRVKVNGEIVVSPGVQVKKGDTVEVGGRVVTPQGLEYLLLNKPEDAITTPIG